MKVIMVWLYINENLPISKMYHLSKNLYDHLEDYIIMLHFMNKDKQLVNLRKAKGICALIF
jgi:hypothetical protein